VRFDKKKVKIRRVFGVDFLSKRKRFKRANFRVRLILNCYLKLLLLMTIKFREFTYMELQVQERLN
jgi:hypothetical protein